MHRLLLPGERHGALLTSPRKTSSPNLGPSCPDGSWTSPHSAPAAQPIGDTRPHRAALEVIVERLVQQVLLAAARGAHEAKVDIVVGARKPLAAGGHSDGIGGHSGGQRGSCAQRALAASTCRSARQHLACAAQLLPLSARRAPLQPPPAGPRPRPVPLPPPRPRPALLPF